MISEELVGKRIRIKNMMLEGIVVYYDRGYVGVKPYLKGTWGYHVVNEDDDIEVV